MHRPARSKRREVFGESHEVGELYPTTSSGPGRVDMLTSPVAAMRAAVATGAWVKSEHDMYLIRRSVGAQALFLPIRRRIFFVFFIKG